jgi:NAD(P)-dependent dehydrogenase (short-subunit alcohol dehydrogenase family)
MEVIRNGLIRRLSGPAKSEGSRKMSTQVVLITGALTGIGRAAAVAFARDGHRIAVAGRHEEAGRELVTELRALGADVEFLRADVRHEDDVRTMVDRAVARFGRLDAAVNNAGTEGQPGPVTQQTANSYAATFDTNVLGTLLIMKHELRVMQAQGSGSIVNISSTYGHEGAAGASVYAASKHAVEGMTKSAALEAAPFGVRVNAVAPGPVETEGVREVWKTPAMIAQAAREVPLQRLGRPEEIAWAVIFVASDQANFMTGETVYVSGGPRMANREDPK